MRYNVDDRGYVNGYGSDAWFNREVNGSEPFGQFDFMNWRQNLATGEWISLIVDYKYIIIPNEMIPAISDKVLLVADICFDKQFDYVLQSTTVEARSGVVGELATMTVKMTPCKVIELTENDKTQLQEIIALFNAKYNPPRYLQCQCYFENEAALNVFVDAQKIS